MYTMAIQLVVDVSWSENTAISAGNGKVYTWTKTKFVESGSNITTETMTCGTMLPVLTLSPIAAALLGGSKTLPEIPDSAWDSSMQPKVMGTATRSGTMLTANPGPVLVGMTLANAATAPWPAATQIMTADHDGDGKPGVTAIPRQSGDFVAPPTSIGGAATDKIYVVSRVVATTSATVDGCPATQMGTADVSKFDNHVVGCHVKGGSECNSDQTMFVDTNSPVFTPKAGTGKFTAKMISDTATCADVRAMLPAPAQ